MLALVFSVTSFLTATLLSAQTPAQRVLLLAPNFSGFCLYTNDAGQRGRAYFQSYGQSQAKLVIDREESNWPNPDGSPGLSYEIFSKCGGSITACPATNPVEKPEWHANLITSITARPLDLELSRCCRIMVTSETNIWLERGTWQTSGTAAKMVCYDGRPAFDECDRTAIAIAPPANANCLLSDFHWVPTPDNAPRLEGTVRLVPEIRVYCILPRNHPIRIDLDPDPLLRPYIELQVWRISNNEFKITLWHSEGMLEVHAIGATTLGGAGQDSRGEAAFSLAMRLTGQNSPLYACCRVIVSGVVQFPLFQGETRYLPDPEQELGLRCFGEHALGTCNEAKARKILDGRDTANNCSDFVSWDSHSEGQGVQ